MGLHTLFQAGNREVFARDAGAMIAPDLSVGADIGSYIHAVQLNHLVYQSANTKTACQFKAEIRTFLDLTHAP